MEDPDKLIDSDASRDDEMLEWLEINRDLRSVHSNELTTVEKMKTKFKANPFVPIGLLATTVVLGMGLNAMRLGQSRKSQLMMRARVTCQGLTIVAILAGIFIGARRSASKPT